MADDEDIAALVVDNGSGMCKGKKITMVLLAILFALVCVCVVMSSASRRVDEEFIMTAVQRQ